MDYSVFPAVKLAGDLQVPGEPQEAAQVLLLAAAAEGESVIANAPPLPGATGALKALGVGVKGGKGTLNVAGGLARWEAPDKPLEPELPAGTAPVLAGLLAGRPFATRLKLDPDDAELPALAEALAGAATPVRRETEALWRLGPAEGEGEIEYDAREMAPGPKQALLLAGLGRPARTVLLEAPNSRDGAERLLRRCGLQVPRQRGEGKEDPNRLSLDGGQAFGGFEAEIPADLERALPFLVAACCLKGSRLRCANVALRPGRRAPLELLRQIGAPLQLSENDQGHTDIEAAFGRLKGTRIGGKRMEPLRRNLALWAVMATQIDGEVVLRDVASMREGAFDYIAHLVESLRSLGARVGEFPEGLVIKGGPRLKGVRVDARGDAGLAAAFGVAGLFARGETVVANADGLEALHPGFFATLESLKEK